MTTKYTAVRVDQECNGDKFWTDLRDSMPHVAKSLERNGCAIVSSAVMHELHTFGAFEGDPSPLIDYGSEGPGYADVVGGKHEVIER